MINNNKTYFILGVSLTALTVVLFKELSPPRELQSRTETIVRMVDSPYVRGAFGMEAEGIKSTLNKSKLKHILIYTNALCDEYGVDYEMVKAVIQTESNWNHKAVSTSGAMGLMQILPSTAKTEFNTPSQELFDPYVNVTIGIKYLSYLNNQFEDMDGTLTAYSHGPTITRQYSKEYIKTNFYVKRVYGNL